MYGTPYNKWINLTALGRHALCLIGSIRVGLIAKVAPVTLRHPAFQPVASARARRLSTCYSDEIGISEKQGRSMKSFRLSNGK